MYDRVRRLAEYEHGTPDNSLPDPQELGFAANETEWGYELWLQWRALGKPSQVSTLMKEIADGYGGVITMLLELESIYDKTKKQIEEQNPKSNGK